MLANTINTYHVHYLKLVTDWEVHAPHEASAIGTIAQRIGPFTQNHHNLPDSAATRLPVPIISGEILSSLDKDEHTSAWGIASEGYDGEVDWVIMEDPEGNGFSVLSPRESRDDDR